MMYRCKGEQWFVPLNDATLMPLNIPQELDMKTKKGFQRSHKKKKKMFVHSKRLWAFRVIPLSRAVLRVLGEKKDHVKMSWCREEKAKYQNITQHLIQRNLQVFLEPPRVKDELWHVHNIQRYILLRGPHQIECTHVCVSLRDHFCHLFRSDWSKEFTGKALDVVNYWYKQQHQYYWEFTSTWSCCFRNMYFKYLLNVSE